MVLCYDFKSLFYRMVSMEKFSVKRLTKSLKFRRETDTITLAEFVNFLIDGGIKNE